MSGDTFCSGRDAIQEVLKRYPIDFQNIHIQEFRTWLHSQWEQKQYDLVFVKRCEIRDVQKQYRDTLRSLRVACKQRQQEFESSPHFQRLEQLQREQNGTRQAIAGLEAAFASHSGPKKQDIANKLQEFLQKQVTLEREEQECLQATPAKHQLDLAEQNLAEFKTKIGLSSLEEELETLKKTNASRSQTAGVRFEDRCKMLVENHIIPQLEQAGDIHDRQRVHVLSRVTLGAADTELDNLVVQVPENPEEPVLVLALVEAKRNINDIASGFLMRQQNLGFLSGQPSLYDPEKHKTQLYREGRFNREFIHQEQGRSFVFASSSFRLFSVAPEVGYIMERLYFVSRNRSLWGLDSEEHSRLMYRISTDIDYNPESDEYLHLLLAWIRENSQPLQTRHILEMYTRKETWAQQVFLFNA